MPPAPQTIRRAWVFVGLIVIVALIVPTFYEIRHEATETRRTIKLADLTLVVANETSDEWATGNVQPDCQIPGPGLLAFFATPADDRPTPAQPDGDESAREDTTFDPTWGNGSEPNWDMFEPQPVRKMPSAPAPIRRYTPVNPVHVSRWWAAKPEPRPDRRPKRPLPVPAATRVVPLPSPGNPIATVD
jgi:hypothetical protein